MSITEEQFEKKYNLYAQELMNISYGYTRNKDDALDVMQNVFFKFFNCEKKFLTENDEKYWLIRVTINECKDLLRRRKRIKYLNDNEIELLKDTNKQINDVDALTLHINNLPEKYRQVIILFYYDCLPIKEIMKILNISENAVKKRLERGRVMIKQKMEV